MEMGEIVYFDDQNDFRKWMLKNHNKVNVIRVAYYKKGAPKKNITYKEAVDVALCFGWIDGLAKSIDEHSHCNRFTPRKKNSIWSQVNIRRYCELKELGLVHAAGETVFENRNPERENLYAGEQTKVELTAAHAKKFKANKKAWANFEKMPPSYRHTTIWWVISAKQEETRLKRLEELIHDSEAGIKVKQLRTKADLKKPAYQQLKKR
jgi:uncharacterized protein YdeI (YjbR/CyaY-like superfamily)